MNNSGIDDIKAQQLLQESKKRTDLLDASKRSRISWREYAVRVVAFFAIVAYVEYSNIDAPNTLLLFFLYFLVLYHRDSRRRECRIDALIELLDLDKTERQVANRSGTKSDITAEPTDPCD